MSGKEYKIVGNKVILYTRGFLCETPEELLASDLFSEITTLYVADLKKRGSALLDVFGESAINDASIKTMISALQHLVNLPISQVPNVVVNSGVFFKDIPLFARFVEQLYDYWRSYDRFIVCDSGGSNLDRRPYRTFNDTIEMLTHLIRGVYRDIEENITGDHPRIYRQIVAGAEVAAISLPKDLALPGGIYAKLKPVPVIRQVLLNPPLILTPPMNKRTGQFVKIDKNPIGEVEIRSNEWLCYPALVGPLLILIYFHERFFELGFSLCNLFELADDEALSRKPDGVYTYGTPGESLDSLGEFPTVFFEDRENELFTAAVPGRDEFGYFGYLKKMVLTLHNSRMIRAGKFPFHGAFVRVILREGAEKNILIIGDTGAGKSEMLEAFRVIGAGSISDIIIIADDMGSIDIDDDGSIIGYGTETGAFLRLDDLQQGYGFGQIDRSIIMSPSMVNARIILPVTDYDTVMKGHKIDMVLYANNYEQIDEEHPVIERFENVDQAFNVFREGTVMSKGTTTSSGIVHSYFANIFGAPQHREVHDKLAMVFFNAFFTNGVFVGQMRTRLGITGYEAKGPGEAASALLHLILDNQG